MTQLGRAITLTPDVLGYWPMSASSGNEIDVVNGWDAVPQTPANIIRAEPSIIPNEEGACALFSGVAGSYFDVADRDELDFAGNVPHSFECWARHDDLVNIATIPHYLLSKRASGNNGYIPMYVVQGSGSIQHFRYNGTVGQNSSASGTSWLKPLHIVTTYDGSVSRIYRNGVLAGNATLANAITATTNPFRIGGHSGGTTVSWLGAIQEVAAYNVDLSPARIWQHYSIGAGLEKVPTDPTEMTFVPASGLPAGFDGTEMYDGLGHAIDFADIVARGGIVTCDPGIQGACKDNPYLVRA